jgi:hypothetical protein
LSVRNLQFRKYLGPSCLNKRWTHDYIRVYRNIQFLSRCCNQQNDVTWRISFDVGQYRLTRKLLTIGQFCSLDISMVPNPDPKQLKSKPSLLDVECKYSGCSMLTHKETKCSRSLNMQQYLQCLGRQMTLYLLRVRLSFQRISTR